MSSSLAGAEVGTEAGVGVGALPSTAEIDEAVRVSLQNKKWTERAEALAEAKVKALGSASDTEEIARIVLPEIVESLSALLIALGEGALTQALLLRELRELRTQQALQHAELVAALQAVGRRVAGPPPGKVAL